MSVERKCKKCGFMEGYRLNFGDEREAERIWHELFKCPKCDKDEKTN